MNALPTTSELFATNQLEKTMLADPLGAGV
jgi:hypothetical protein